MAAPTIDALPPAPQRTDTPTQFSDKADAFLGGLPGFRTQANDVAQYMNDTAIGVEEANDAADTALAAANYAGRWADLTGALSPPASVFYSESFWLLEVELADVTTSEPALANADWTVIDGSDVLSILRYDLASVTATATLDLSAAQVFRVDASTSRTLAFANQPGVDRAMTVVVHITGNSAVTWPSGIDWDSDTAPELGDTETKVVLLWDGVEWSGFVRVAK